eukprot:scaffold30085_cov63-Phaeocystis_antarctica.AAC.6
MRGRGACARSDDSSASRALRGALVDAQNWREPGPPLGRDSLQPGPKLPNGADRVRSYRSSSAVRDKISSAGGNPQALSAVDFAGPVLVPLFRLFRSSLCETNAGNPCKR